MGQSERQTLDVPNATRHARILACWTAEITNQCDGVSPSEYKGANVKRSRRGGRRPQNGHNGHMGGGNGGGGGGGHNPNRTFDSSGPEIKIRGSASHVYEKYLQLARDANASGDRIMAENYLQHAEHYFRILAVSQAQQQQYQQQNPQAPQNPQQNPQNNGGQYRQPNGAGEQPFVQQPGAPSSGPSFSLTENQDEGDEDDGEEADTQE